MQLGLRDDRLYDVVHVGDQLLQHGTLLFVDLVDLRLEQLGLHVQPVLYLVLEVMVLFLEVE